MKSVHSTKKLDYFLPKFSDLSGAKDCKSCRSRKMLENAPTLAIVAVHTEENEPPKISGAKFHSFNPILSHEEPVAAAALGVLGLLGLHWPGFQGHE